MTVKKILIGLSIVLNILILATLAVAYTMPGQTVQMMLAGVLGKSHERWMSQFSLLPIVKGDVVFLGDSITRGGSWHELFPDQPVKNRGIGGDTSEGILTRVDQIIGEEPSSVFLLIGTNDIYAGIDLAEIENNVGQVIHKLDTESPATKVYLQSVLPRAHEYQNRIESLNVIFERLAAEQGATWVDLYPLFLDADGSINNTLSNDELHLTGKGYLVWRDHIADLVYQ